jgi:hypothetical protein
MEREAFLDSQPWLVLVPSDVRGEIERTCQLQSILSDAVCCFQTKGAFVWFAPSVTNIDCTQLFLEVFLIVDKMDKAKSPGLAFVIDGSFFLVDHTAMGRIHAPNAQQENIEAVHGPRYALISWPHQLEMRIFCALGTPDTAATTRLLRLIQGMIDALQPHPYRHPALAGLLKGMGVDAAASASSGRRSETPAAAATRTAASSGARAGAGADRKSVV